MENRPNHSGLAKIRLFLEKSRDFKKSGFNWLIRGGGVCTLIGKENSVSNFALAFWACLYGYQPNSFWKLPNMIGSAYKTFKY